LLALKTPLHWTYLLLGLLSTNILTLGWMLKKNSALANPTATLPTKPSKPWLKIPKIQKQATNEIDSLTLANSDTTQYKMYLYDIPAGINFAGEVVPLEIEHIFEKLELEFTEMTCHHAGLMIAMKRANRWFPQMEPILRKHGIPDDFKYLAIVESYLSNATSPKKAKGYWQFLEETAEIFGLEVSEDVDERLAPLKATEAACLYFKEAYGKFNSWTSAAASYNMGMGGVQKHLNQQYGNSFYDLQVYDETTRYIYRAIAIKFIFQNPDKFHLNIPTEQLYFPTPVRKVSVSASLENLADFAKSQQISYAALKAYNPWLINTKLEVKSGKNYVIDIPLDKDSVALYQELKINYLNLEKLNTIGDSLQRKPKKE